MTKVLVRKARDGPLPKPISEMSDEERAKFGLPSRSKQRSGEALNIRRRKGVERIPSVPRETAASSEAGEADYEEVLTDTGPRKVRVIRRDPETGQPVQFADALHEEDYTDEEREAARLRHEKFMEEKGRALGRRRGDPAEFEDIDSFETELTPGFRYGMDATARTDIDQPTGKKRRTITRNIEAGEEGSGFTERMLIRDPSGTHPAFGDKQSRRRVMSRTLGGAKGVKRDKDTRSVTEMNDAYTDVDEQGNKVFRPNYEARIKETMPLDKYLGWLLSNDFNAFQKLFAADPTVMRSLGRGKSMSQSERNQVVAEAMESMRQNPDLISQMIGTQGLEIEQDTSQMGAMGSSQVKSREDLVELARQLRLSNPQAILFSELDAALTQDGMRAEPEALADYVRQADPQDVNDAYSQVDQLLNQLYSDYEAQNDPERQQAQMEQARKLGEELARASPEVLDRRQRIEDGRVIDDPSAPSMREKLQAQIDSLQGGGPSSILRPMETSADEFGGRVVGRGKFVEPDPEKTVEIDPTKREAQKAGALEERLRNEFMVLGVGDADSNPEGFQRFKNHINSKIDAQAEQVMRLQNQSGKGINITLDQAREMVMGGKEGFFSQAGMDNALESARVMAEQGMFDQEQEGDVYSGSMFDEMDAARAQSVRDAQEGRSENLDELMDQKRLLQGIIEQQRDPMNPNSSPEQLQAFQRQLSMLNQEISEAQQANRVHLGGRPTQAQTPADVSPQARRTAAAFRQGNVGVAGKDEQNLTGRSPDRTNAPLTIPGMEGEMSDSTFDRTVPDSKDERRGQRKRMQARRASGTDFSALGDAGTPAADPAAPAPAGGGTITAADILAQLGQMNVPAQPKDDDDTVETGQWMSVGEQLLKGIEAHMFKSW